MVDPSTVSDWGQAFTPRFIEAARAHRSPVKRKWHVDETLLKIGGRWRDGFRAIDEGGQIVDVSLSDRRDADSAQAFFTQALAATATRPVRVTAAKAKCSPPAPRTVRPDAEQHTSKDLNNRLERDHQHLKGRVRPMRRFKSTGTASTVCRGPAVVRNLRHGFSCLTTALPPRLRLATARALLAAAL